VINLAILNVIERFPHRVSKRASGFCGGNLDLFVLIDNAFDWGDYDSGTSSEYLQQLNKQAQLDHSKTVIKHPKSKLTLSSLEA
jgi:hypothetical protein